MADLPPLPLELRDDHVPVGCYAVPNAEMRAAIQREQIHQRTLDQERRAMAAVRPGPRPIGDGRCTYVPDANDRDEEILLGAVDAGDRTVGVDPALGKDQTGIVVYDERKQGWVFVDVIGGQMEPYQRELLERLMNE